MLTEIARTTFGIGGPGMVLWQLMLLGVVGGWLLVTITKTAGQGQIASMISVTSVFIGISLVAGVAWGVIQVVARIAGIY